jgi:arginase family enzyme
MTHPVVQAVHARHGPLTILHCDAHPDLYADFAGNSRRHASPFARIMEGGLARRLVQVGIRTLNRHCREQAERYGVEIVPLADFTPASVPVLEGPLYISIDLDGIDPSEAPGVSHPEPGGLTVREVLAVLRRQTAPVVGADIVELNPRFDYNERTAILAAKLVREVAALIAHNGGWPSFSATLGLAGAAATGFALAPTSPSSEPPSSPSSFIKPSMIGACAR